MNIIKAENEPRREFVYSNVGHEVTLAPCPRGHGSGVQALAPALHGREPRFMCTECGLRYSALPADAEDAQQ